MKTKKSVALLLAMMAGATAAGAADFEFWYGNTGRPEMAIQAHCEAFNASQDEHNILCVGQGGYEAGMQKAIAAYRSGKHPVLIQFFDAGTLDLMLSDAVIPVSDILPDVDWSDYNVGARSYYETSTGELFSQPTTVRRSYSMQTWNNWPKLGSTSLPKPGNVLWKLPGF